MQSGRGDIETQLRLIAEGQRRIEQRLTTLHWLVALSLGVTLWWILRLIDDIEPIGPRALPWASPFMLRFANDFTPFLVAFVTVLVVVVSARYRPWAPSKSISMSSSIPAP